jgi:hypothetical protein
MFLHHGRVVKEGVKWGGEGCKGEKWHNGEKKRCPHVGSEEILLSCDVWRVIVWLEIFVHIPDNVLKY